GTLARAARFRQWDGSQTLPELEADEIMDALADDLMAEGDISGALRRLMERGWHSGDPTRQDLRGLQDLIERLRQRRQELLDRYKLGDVLSDVRRELDDIEATERSGIERRLDTASRDGGPSSEPAASSPAGDKAAAESPQLRSMLRDMAARRLDQLDALPSELGGRIRGLQEYDFLEPEARDRFNDLVARLQRQVLDQFVSGLSDAIKGITPKDLAANRDMV